MSLYFASDFSWQGPYVGQMEAAAYAIDPTLRCVHLMHDLPKFNILASSFIVEALFRQIPVASALVAVVDPGVGSDERLPVALHWQDRWLLGPGNGLFESVLQTDEVSCYEIDWQPEKLSDSFHGRDLFAPVAAMLLSGRPNLLKPIGKPRWQQQSRQQLVYIDDYGNCWSGLRSHDLAQTQQIHIAGQNLHYARTFSQVRPGELFWYVNSQGLIEIAANQASAAAQLSVAIGHGFKVS